MDIQEIKKKIRSLYDELKKEVDGRIVLPSGTYIPPSAMSYCKKANELVEEVKKYCELDKTFDIAHVLHTLDKEVSYVRDYDGKGKSKKKQKEELENCMRKTTNQLSYDLFLLLNDNEKTP